MLVKRKMKFRPGNRTLQLKQEERIFLLEWAKTLNPKTEIEKRIVRRFLMRLMGERGYYPLYPPKECPHCEARISGAVYDMHLLRCIAKIKMEKRRPRIDPSVLEMMEAGL